MNTILLVCPKFRDLRRKFLKPYYCHWPNYFKLEILMSTQNTKLITNLAKYIYQATKIEYLRHSNVCVYNYICVCVFIGICLCMYNIILMFTYIFAFSYSFVDLFVKNTSL